MTVKLLFLVCVAFFPNGFFFSSTLYLVFKLPRILTFNNQIRQQNSLQRGKQISGDVHGVRRSGGRDLRASVAFHKGTLMCSEDVEANKDSTGFILRSPSCTKCGTFSNVSCDSRDTCRMCGVIIQHLIVKEHTTELK